MAPRQGGKEADRESIQRGREGGKGGGRKGLKEGERGWCLLPKKGSGALASTGVVGIVECLRLVVAIKQSQRL